MSCFSGRMKEYERISLDRFDGKNLQSTVYFLSHLHEDHTVGLATPVFFKHLKTSKNVFLYCSEVTEVLIKASKKYRHLIPYVKTLAINTPTTIEIPDPLFDEIETVTVTCLPAFHCPGSVMCLFEGNEGTVLYTGDFRWEHFNIEQMYHLRSGENVKKVKSLYVDTTFCTPENLYIPSRQHCIDATYQLVYEWISQSPQHVVYMSLRAQYGHEPLLNAVASRLGKKIHVESHKVDVYNQINEFHGNFTSDGTSTQIHACGKEAQNIDGEHIPCRQQHDPEKVLVILPTTMYFTQFQHLTLDKIVRKVGDCFYRVCYSFHSSYTELKDLISYLKPDNVYPNVKPPNDASLAFVQHRLNTMLGECLQFDEPVDITESEVKQLGTLRTRSSRRVVGKRKHSMPSESNSLDFGTPTKVQKVDSQPLRQTRGRGHKPASESSQESDKDLMPGKGRGRGRGRQTRSSQNTATQSPIRSSGRLRSKQATETELTQRQKTPVKQQRSDSPDLFMTPSKSEMSEKQSSYTGSLGDESEIDLSLSQKSLDFESTSESKGDNIETWTGGSFLTVVSSHSSDDDGTCVCLYEDVEQTDENFQDVSQVEEDEEEEGLTLEDIEKMETDKTSTNLSSKKACGRKGRRSRGGQKSKQKAKSQEDVDLDINEENMVKSAENSEKSNKKSENLPKKTKINDKSDDEMAADGGNSENRNYSMKQTENIQKLVTEVDTSMIDNDHAKSEYEEMEKNSQIDEPDFSKTNSEFENKGKVDTERKFIDDTDLEDKSEFPMKRKDEKTLEKLEIEDSLEKSEQQNKHLEKEEAETVSAGTARTEVSETDTKIISGTCNTDTEIGKQECSSNDKLPETINELSVETEKCLKGKQNEVGKCSEISVNVKQPSDNMENDDGNNKDNDTVDGKEADLEMRNPCTSGEDTEVSLQSENTAEPDEVTMKNKGTEGQEIAIAIMERTESELDIVEDKGFQVISEYSQEIQNSLQNSKENFQDKNISVQFVENADHEAVDSKEKTMKDTVIEIIGNESNENITDSDNMLKHTEGHSDSNITLDVKSEDVEVQKNVSLGTSDNELSVKVEDTLDHAHGSDSNDSDIIEDTPPGERSVLSSQIHISDTSLIFSVDKPQQPYYTRHWPLPPAPSKQEKRRKRKTKQKRKKYAALHGTIYYDSDVEIVIKDEPKVEIDLTVRKEYDENDFEYDMNKKRKKARKESGKPPDDQLITVFKREKFDDHMYGGTGRRDVYKKEKRVQRLKYTRRSSFELTAETPEDSEFIAELKVASAKTENIKTETKRSEEIELTSQSMEDEYEKFVSELSGFKAKSNEKNKKANSCEMSNNFGKEDGVQIEADEEHVSDSQEDIEKSHETNQEETDEQRKNIIKSSSSKTKIQYTESKEGKKLMRISLSGAKKVEVMPRQNYLGNEVFIDLSTEDNASLVNKENSPDSKSRVDTHSDETDASKNTEEKISISDQEKPSSFEGEKELNDNARKIMKTDKISVSNDDIFNGETNKNIKSMNIDISSAHMIENTNIVCKQDGEGKPDKQGDRGNNQNDEHIEYWEDGSCIVYVDENSDESNDSGEWLSCSKAMKTEQKSSKQSKRRKRGSRKRNANLPETKSDIKRLDIEKEPVENVIDKYMKHIGSSNSSLFTEDSEINTSRNEGNSENDDHEKRKKERVKRKALEAMFDMDLENNSNGRTNKIDSVSRSPVDDLYEETISLSSDSEVDEGCAVKSGIETSSKQENSNYSSESAARKDNSLDSSKSALASSSMMDKQSDFTRESMGFKEKAFTPRTAESDTVNKKSSEKQRPEDPNLTHSRDIKSYSKNVGKKIGWKASSQEETLETVPMEMDETSEENNSIEVLTTFNTYKTQRAKLAKSRQKQKSRFSSAAETGSVKATGPQVFVSQQKLPHVPVQLFPPLPPHIFSVPPPPIFNTPPPQIPGMIGVAPVLSVPPPTLTLPVLPVTSEAPQPKSDSASSFLASLPGFNTQSLWSSSSLPSTVYNTLNKVLDVVMSTKSNEKVSSATTTTQSGDGITLVSSKIIGNSDQSQRSSQGQSIKGLGSYERDDRQARMRDNQSYTKADMRYPRDENRLAYSVPRYNPDLKRQDDVDIERLRRLDSRRPISPYRNRPASPYQDRPLSPYSLYERERERARFYDRERAREEFYNDFEADRRRREYDKYYEEDYHRRRDLDPYYDYPPPRPRPYDPYYDDARSSWRGYDDRPRSPIDYEDLQRPRGYDVPPRAPRDPYFDPRDDPYYGQSSEAYDRYERTHAGQRRRDPYDNDPYYRERFDDPRRRDFEESLSRLSNEHQSPLNAPSKDKIPSLLEKQTTANEQKKHFQKYKPPPKTQTPIVVTRGKRVSSSQQGILEKAQASFSQPVSMGEKHETSSQEREKPAFCTGLNPVAIERTGYEYRRQTKKNCY